MNKKLSISVLFTIIILSLSITIPMIVRKTPDHEVIMSPASITVEKENKKTEEMRGLWVSYISLDMSYTDRSFESFKEKFDSIINKAKELKCNTLIVQVRPFCDALYDSALFPYSHIITGTQGKSPGYDALEYMCSTCHNSEIKIHAWINPYRIKSMETPDKLSTDNIFVTDPDICIETKTGVYLNPANIKARELIINGVKEIIENYNIDGIQFDDYFYPTDINDMDKSEYNTYIKSNKSEKSLMSVEEWRKTNVNILIAEVYRTIKATNSEVIFGISPQGNIKNNDQISADVESWCKYKGYIDYICPQIYFPLDSTSLDYTEALEQWSVLSYYNNIKVYIGLGLYKAGTSADNGAWLDHDNILSTELKLLRKQDFGGFILYDYNALISEEAQKELSNLISCV